MGAASEALSAILAAGPRGLFDVWDAIDDQIGKAKAPGLRERLIELRARFAERAGAAEVGRLKKVLAQSPDDAWTAWQIALADSISHFRHVLSAQLAAFGFELPGRADEASEVVRAVQCMRQDRWPEAYDQIEKLSARPFLPTELRGKLLCVLGQIQLFVFRKFGSARKLLERAEALAPRDVYVISVMGDYWMQEEAPDKDLPKAESYYRRALEIAPQAVDGYLGMGAICEEKKDLKAAEGWYSKAVAADSGDSGGYRRLIQLYASPELFERHEADLVRLTELAVAVGNPEGEYARYVELGNVYVQNKQFDKGRRWYDKAIALDGSNPAGYLALAAYHEKLGNLDDAEASYKRAIEVAPQSYDGYWGLTWFYEERGRWREALEWYEKAPQYRAEWTGLLRAKIGEMYAKLDRRPEAEDLLRRELAADKDNYSAKEFLHTIAEDYYLRLGDRASAERIYAAILDILGQPYAAEYHNRLGNLSYYFDEYDKSAAEYRLAIAAKPSVAGYHRNLATAYRALKHYDEALQELERARAIDQDVEVFAKEMAQIANDQANDCYTRGEYRRAIELYGKAIDENPADSVFHENLAQAWEQVAEPNQKMHALDRALEAYRRADSIRPGGKHARDIERLSHRKEFASSYGEKVLDWPKVVAPIVVEVAGDLIPLFEGGQAGGLSDEVAARIADLRKNVERRFGVEIPGVRVRRKEAGLQNGTYVILLRDIPVVSGTVMVERCYFPGTRQALSSLGVAGQEGPHPATGQEGFWIERADWERVRAAGHELWAPMKYLFTHLEGVVGRNLPDFVGYDEVAQLVEAISPAGLKELRAQAEKRTALTAVCKALLAEEASLSPFAAVYDAFQRSYSAGAGRQSMVERIRALPELGPGLAGNQRGYEAVPLGPHYELELRRAIYYSGPHSLLAMEPERCQAALTALRNGLAGTGSVSVSTSLVVDDPDLRPLLRRMIELEFPSIPVLSKRELRRDSRVAQAPIDLGEDSTPPEPVRKTAALRASSDLVVGQGEKESVPPAGEVGITVFVSGAAAQNRASADDQPLETMLSMMEEDLYYELGLILPKVKLEIDASLEVSGFRFRLNGLEGPPIRGLEADEFLVKDTVEGLARFGIEGRPAINPANGSACAIIREQGNLSRTCKDLGLTTWGPGGFLMLTLSAQIRKSAPAFQTADVTSYILHSLRKVFPELMDAALARFSVERICLLLRNLLREEISVRNMKTILESMLAVDGTTDVDLNRYIVFMPYADSLCPVARNKLLSDLTVDDYTNVVRASLKRYISTKYTRGGNTLVVYLLDPDIEKRIGEAAGRPLTDEERARLKHAVNDKLRDLPPSPQPPVVLTTMDVRLPIKKLLEPDFPNLAVLSYQELSPDLNIRFARISWRE